MDKEIRDEWVKRLRSGQYNQARSVLRKTDDTYCCLGVLCEMAVEQGIINRRKENGMFSYGLFQYESDYRIALLPDEVMDWAGLSSENCVYGTDVTFSLAADNDAGKNFGEIADLIEKWL